VTDDNASGTALLLEIAGVLSEYVARDEAVGANRRSIMFQAYGAEEVGLVGSYHFCRQPAVHMDSIVTMVNLDMVGRLTGYCIAATSTAFTRTSGPSCSCTRGFMTTITRRATMSS
jgi:Zn-dependent M28 family amino/carboxypeptidase